MISSDYSSICQELERQELDASNDIASFQTYAKLLAIYLYENDLCNAKFLWKRIPDEIKSDNPELGLIWNVGRNMWQRNYPGTYTALNVQWSECVASIMQAAGDAVRKRAVELISRAYSSISLTDFAVMVGLSSEDAVKLVLDQGWMFDGEASMIQPVKGPSQSGETTSSEDQLYKLTQFVSFLEN